MPHKTPQQLSEELCGLDEPLLANVRSLYALHKLFYAALKKEGWRPSSAYTDCLQLSSYGQELTEISGARSEAFDESCIRLAAFDQFYHEQLLLDSAKCDVEKLAELLSSDLLSENLKFPVIYGREAYEQYHSIFAGVRLEQLGPEQVDAVFAGLLDGAFQVGEWTVGPLGFVRSRGLRYVTPLRSVPLWHCADVGCNYVHHVVLGESPHPIDEIVSALIMVADLRGDEELPWLGPLDNLQRTESYHEPQRYFDLPAYLYQAFSLDELQSLMLLALGGVHGRELRQSLNEAFSAAFTNVDRNKLASKLSRSACVQLLLTLSNRYLVELIDQAIFSRSIRVPASEVRVARFTPPRESPFDGICELSSLGMRSVVENPNVLLASLLWRAYEGTNLLSDLSWRCRAGTISPNLGTITTYIKEYGPSVAIAELVLPSRPIFEHIQRELWFELPLSQDSADSIDRILWKIGFDPPRYERTLETLFGHLSDFRDAIFASGKSMSERERADIRAAGVNVFVMLERVLEDFVSFNVWALTSDHFVNTRFEYNSQRAVESVSEVIPPPETLAGIVWKPEGGNTLGTLLAYGRAAADWMKQLPGKGKTPFRHAETELPHFAMNRDKTFPFLHKELWADCDLAQLQEFSSTFDDIVQLLELSRLAEVRNGIDHYRDEDQFPDQNLLLACESRVSAAVEAADIKRFLPKAYWAIERRSDHFDRVQLTLSDYRGRKVTVDQPSVFRGLPSAGFHQAVVLPFGNLLGVPTGEIAFRVRDSSDYSRMWESYPRRPPDVPAQVQPSSLAPPDEEEPDA